jgi:hypothetical protein
LRYVLRVIALSGICAGACFAQETVTASRTALTVEVANGTTDGAAVTGDMVFVQIYEHEQLAQTLQSKADADGKAVFENVPAGADAVGVARAKHQDIMFSSPPVLLGPAQERPVIQVRVFDVSDDKSKLSVETHHIIIKAKSGSLELTEYMLLKNSSEMAISSKETDSQGRTIVLDIMLPRGFKNLKPSSYFEEEALVVTENGFYDVLAVPPDEHDVVFSYTTEATSDSIDIVKEISLPTSDIVVFAELGEVQLQGLGEAKESLIRPDGKSVQYYKIGRVAAGEEITFHVTGRGASGSVAGWVILAAAFGAMTILALLRLRPGRS